ncbi:MAG TPA: cytochrome c [Burkholderiales bacterium]|nr:cytochrome c [Burkholderiales bacterium]
MKFHAAILLFTLGFGASLAAPAAGPNTARELAANCANCHGTDGKSAGVMPPLAGLDRSYLVRHMQDFKAGRRPATIMHQLAKGYSDEQIELIADYFAAQK